MQLLIDVSQETPDSLLLAAEVLKMLSAAMVPVDLETPKEKPASINGPSTPIILHAHGPAAPIDPRPQACSDSFAPADSARLDPSVVFGRVPAGTINPTPAAVATFVPGVSTGVGVAAPLAPPAPAAQSTMTVVPSAVLPGLLAPVPPVSLTIPPAVSDATTTAGTTAPAAPVAANIPTTPDTAAVATASNGRDKDGLPWDARVHSETRKMNADGTWRYRRNLDALVKAAVTAELKALYGGQLTIQTGMVSLPAAPPAPQAPPAPTAPPAPVAPQPPAAPMPVSDGVPLGVPNPGQSAAVQALGFRDFMSAVNKATQAGRLTAVQLNNACKAVNLDGVSALASDPGKISLVHNQIAHLLVAPTA